jgi:hypothetical protein
VERTFIQSNIVDTPEVGKEYYIWDKVVGPIDADIVTVDAIEGNQVTIRSMTNASATSFSASVESLIWEWDKQSAETNWDEVYPDMN